MKRVLWTFAAVALTTAALFAFAIRLIPREALKVRMSEQIAAWTGREVSLRGEPQIDFFPRLTVTLDDVRVGGPAGMKDAEIVSMDRLTGEVRLLPLVIGRVEIGSFSMLRPMIKLVYDEEGGRNWIFDSGAAALQLAFAGDVPLGEFVVEDGTILYENRSEGLSERLDSVNLALEWLSVRRPLTISGSGIWRGEEVVLAGAAEAPFEFLNGAATPLEAQLDAAPIAIVFGGEAAGVETPQLAGALTMATPSLRGFAAWLGSPIGAGPTLGPASLSGTATYDDGVLSVEGAALMLDGNSAAGALSVVVAARPQITGTLDFSALDLTPYFAGLSAALTNPDDWGKVGIDTGWFGSLVSDIRLSAASLRIGSLQFGSTAASVILNDARMEIGIAGAAFNNGSLSGDLTIADIPDRPDANLEIRLHATDFDLAEAAPAFGLPSGLSGTASIALDLAGGGQDLDSLMSTLGGTGMLSIENGALPLFGIAELAAARDEADPATADFGAVTPVEYFAARLSFREGIATLEAEIDAASFTADVAGGIGLAEGGLSLRGAVQPPDGAGPLAFEIDGTLAHPLARPMVLAN
jgi:AsmA protein